MIEKLLIKNYKCFPEKEINFKKLTLLVGGNASGKSSVIQSLLITRMSMEQINLTKKKNFYVSLNNNYAMQLGLSRYVISSQPTSNEIEMAIQTNDGKEKSFIYNLNEDLHPLSLIGTILSCEDADFSVNSSFRYLNAERIGPRKGQEMAQNTELQVGFHGEYTNHAIFYADKIKRKLPESLVGDDKSPKFSAQVEAWLKTIIPSTQFNVKTVEEAGLASLQYQNERLGTDFYNPPNTGFGITYVLPIIVAALLASTEEQPILIIENPEAHLHPSGQSRIGAFLSLISDAGVQVIIETHSEHVVNGARLQLAKMKKTENLLINFFEQEDKRVEIEEVKINPFGELTSWPSGFLDQDRKDLRELINIKRKGYENA